MHREPDLVWPPTGGPGGPGGPHTTGSDAGTTTSRAARGTATARPGAARRGPLRVGIGGPVGSGKTALVAALCRTLGAMLELAVVTNDIYTTEDADFLRRNAVLPSERIAAVATGCCPHTAIRDDISANLDALEDLAERFAPLDLLLLESGGDNLTATFSTGLIDAQIFVIDVSGATRCRARAGPASPARTCWWSTRPTWRQWSGPTSA